MCMDWFFEDDKSWNRALRMTLVKSLTGLRSLRLQINYSMNAALYQSAKARGNELGLYQMRQLRFVEKFAPPSLRDVEVFVSDFPGFVGDAPGFDSDDPDPAPPVNLRPLWTAEDRIEYAEGIRKILLDPKGADVYAQRQKARSLSKRKRKKEGATDLQG